MSESYADYLKSDHWKEVSAIRRALDQNKCAACGSTKALHVHHITYKNYGHEKPATDLITLCRKCHTTLHANKKAIKVEVETAQGAADIKREDERHAADIKFEEEMAAYIKWKNEQDPADLVYLSLPFHDRQELRDLRRRFPELVRPNIKNDYGDVDNYILLNKEEIQQLWEVSEAFDCIETCVEMYLYPGMNKTEMTSAKQLERAKIAYKLEDGTLYLAGAQIRMWYIQIRDYCGYHCPKWIGAYYEDDDYDGVLDYKFQWIRRWLGLNKNQLPNLDIRLYKIAVHYAMETHFKALNSKLSQPEIAKNCFVRSGKIPDRAIWEKVAKYYYGEHETQIDYFLNSLKIEFGKKTWGFLEEEHHD